MRLCRCRNTIFQLSSQYSGGKGRDRIHVGSINERSLIFFLSLSLSLSLACLSKENKSNCYLQYIQVYIRQSKNTTNRVSLKLVKRKRKEMDVSNNKRKRSKERNKKKACPSRSRVVASKSPPSIHPTDRPSLVISLLGVFARRNRFGSSEKIV